MSQGVKLALSHFLAGLSIGFGFSYTRDNPGTHCNAVHIMASLLSSMIMAVACWACGWYDIALPDYHLAIGNDGAVNYDAVLFPSWSKREEGVPLIVHIKWLLMEVAWWYLGWLASKWIRADSDDLP